MRYEEGKMHANAANGRTQLSEGKIEGNMNGGCQVDTG